MIAMAAPPWYQELKCEQESTLAVSQPMYFNMICAVQVRFLPIVFVAAFLGCRAKTDSAIAHFPGSVVSKAEIQRELATEPAHVRRSFNSSLEAKKRYVEQLTRSKTLLEEAKRQKIDQDPALLRRFRQMIVDTLIQRLREKITPVSIKEVDVKQFFEEHRAEYERPAMVRAAQLVVGTREEAEALRTEVESGTSLGERLARFQAAAARKSVDAQTRYRGGDIGFLHAGSAGLPGPILKAALGLNSDGDLAPVTEMGPTAWAVVMRTGGRPEMKQPLDDVRSAIQMRLVNERRGKVVEEVLQKLQGGQPVKIDEAALAEVNAPEDAPGNHE